MRLALSGCGEISGYVALAARLNPRIRIVACADPREERRSAFAARFGIPHTYPSQGEMLAAEQPEGLYLAVPHDLHLPLAAEAAEAGVAVLCEKPLARNAREGAELLARIGATQVPVAVNYQWRYDAKCRALIENCRRGLLGELRYLRIHLPWYRRTDYFTSAPWHAERRRSGGGTLLTQGSHPLDIALLASGAAPKRARGFCTHLRPEAGETEELAFGLIECENGVLIQLCSSMLSSPERAVTIEVQGSAGALRYTGPRFPRLRFYGGKLRSARRPGSSQRPRRLRGRPVVSEFDPLYRSLEGFRRWISGGAPHRCRAEEALDVLRAVDGIYASALIAAATEVPSPAAEGASVANGATAAERAPGEKPHGEKQPGGNAG
jgi:predicted dehydrogenase